jgi:hypothetical protein
MSLREAHASAPIALLFIRDVASSHPHDSALLLSSTFPFSAPPMKLKKPLHWTFELTKESKVSLHYILAPFQSPRRRGQFSSRPLLRLQLFDDGSTARDSDPVPLRVLLHRSWPHHFLRGQIRRRLVLLRSRHARSGLTVGPSHVTWCPLFGRL